MTWERRSEDALVSVALREDRWLPIRRDGRRSSTTVIHVRSGDPANLDDYMDVACPHPLQG
jgi:hypothetical protein